jgi:hypothetical protein
MMRAPQQILFSFFVEPRGEHHLDKGTNSIAGAIQHITMPAGNA